MRAVGKQGALEGGVEGGGENEKYVTHYKDNDVMSTV